jgi:hypothetical protein
MSGEHLLSGVLESACFIAENASNVQISQVETEKAAKKVTIEFPNDGHIVST